jgi:uncharacterized protein (DUF1919 family)
MKSKVKGSLKSLRSYYRRTKIQNNDFSIISNNCWGGFVSQYFGLSYNSPFVGLFIFSPDYIKLLRNIKYYLSLNLCFINPNNSRYKDELMKNNTIRKYPIGLLDDVEIHFLHYKDTAEAFEKWERRKKRINFNNMIVKFCERDLATEDLIEQFDQLNFKNKICLTSKKYNMKSCVKLVNEEGGYIENEWTNYLKTESPVKTIRKFELE